MNAGALLNADMATLARGLRAGFAWWREELGGLLPARLRSAFDARPATRADWLPGGGFALRRGDRTISLDAARRRPLPVTAVLPASHGLVREVTLPLLGAADTRRLVMLDIDRLLPFPPGAAYADVVSLTREPAASRQTVAVGAVPRAVAREVVEAGARRGLRVGALGLETAGGVRFDFVPALAADTVDGAGQAARRFWWTVIAIALLLNLALLVGRDVQQLRRLEELVSAHGEAAASARALRQRVIAEDARRRALIAARDRREPLTTLATLTRLLPDGVWVQRLSIDGGSIRLVGFRDDRADVLAALRRTGRFANLRAGASDSGGGPGGVRPFDISMDAVPGREPPR